MKRKGLMCYNCKDFGNVKKECPLMKGKKLESKSLAKKIQIIRALRRRVTVIIRLD